MMEKFSTTELSALRNELIQTTLDCWQAAELFQVFLMGRGYGVSAGEALSAATRVVEMPWLRGTCPTARSPRGARAERRVRRIVAPVSSTKTKSSGHSAATVSRQAARFTGFCSLAWSVFFFASSPGA